MFLNRSLFRLPYFCLLFLLLVIMACKRNEKEQLLTRKWKVSLDVESHISRMSEEEKEIFDRLPDSLKKQKIEQTQRIANQNTFEFKPDKTFELVLLEENIEQRGTWELMNEGTLLRVTKEKKEESEPTIEQDLRIQELSKERLVIYLKDSSGRVEEVILTPE